jgi:hypothetical protein
LDGDLADNEWLEEWKDSGVSKIDAIHRFDDGDNWFWGSDSDLCGIITGVSFVIGISQIPLNTWTYVKAVFNDTDNSMSLYINDQLDATVPITLPYSDSSLGGAIGNNRWSDV